MPHASGDDTARPRNLSEGALDRILAVAMGKRFGNSARGADGMAQVAGMSTEGEAEVVAEPRDRPRRAWIQDPLGACWSGRYGPRMLRFFPPTLI